MIVEVAAAVLQRADGSFLLARRPAGKVFAGYWEFPGGKVEPGEAPGLALARELHEELGVEVEQAYPWITRVFAYPHATVRLRFYRVLQWRNEPHPREKQALAWQRLDDRMAEPMLPANAPVLASLALPWEYAITDAGALGIPGMLALLEERLEQGLKLVQIREPKLTATERSLFTEQAIGLAHRYGCKVMVKAPSAATISPGAHGLHLTAAQLMELESRPVNMLVAASCHTRAELERAMQLELDFAVLGPVKKTASHEGDPPLGWEKFTAMTQEASIPVYAIGGLDVADRNDAWSAGGHGLAMISGAWRQGPRSRPRPPGHP
jgi:8-oxo-dGTP diphosphatase